MSTECVGVIISIIKVHFLCEKKVTLPLMITLLDMSNLYGFIEFMSNHLK